MAFHNKLKRTLAAFLSAATVSASVSAAIVTPTASAADSKNYLEALAMSLYMFDSNACGTGVTGGPLTWRGDCHTYDSKASLEGIDGSAKQYADPDGDGTIDLSGGWHDAGDHIKFNITIGFGMSALGLSEFLNEGIYAKAGARDHLEYEMRWGAEYLMKTTILDGSGNVAAVAGTVADGGVDHSIWTAPETQTYERKVFWLNPGSNNSAVCCEMAAGLGAAAYILKDSDPDFSAKCVKYSKALLDYGTKHVGNNCEGMSFYSTDSQYQDEESMAQAWLWQLGAGSKPARVPHNKDYGNSQYDGWLFSWDKVWQGYSAFMYRATKDSAFKDELIVELNDRDGGLEVGRYNMAGSGWGNARYNCALQMDAFTVADGDPNSSYAKAAKWQMDYILGDNNLGYSFLIGFGDKWPTHIHHRAANPGENGETSAANPSAKYTNYGMLVGGIDRDGYQDHADKYQYTEGALDYNGCFALACASCANLYGGDNTTFNEIKLRASEINDDFVFGNGSESKSDAEKYEPKCQTDTPRSSIPFEFVIENFDKPTRNWEVTFGGSYASSTHVTYTGADSFTVVNDSGGSVDVIVTYSDGSSDTVTVMVKNSTTTTGTTTTITTTQTTFAPAINFTANISVVDKNTSAKLSGASLKLYEHITYADGRKVLNEVDRWDTDFDNPYQFNKAVLSGPTVTYLYEVEIVSYPQGYTSDKTSWTFSSDVSDGWGTYSVVIGLDPVGSQASTPGDSNCDGNISVADVVLIMQCMANPGKYGVGNDGGITAQGLINADVVGNDGVTSADALEIQQYLIGLDSVLKK